MTLGTPDGAGDPLTSLRDIDPKYLKLSYLPGDGSFSRRDLLFRVLTPRCQVVPAVEVEACTAWKGCAQCLAACPQQAIAIDGSAATIDKAKCIGCGACLPVCPVGAIRHPLLNPEQLDAELRALLQPDEANREPRSLFLVADGGPVPEAIAPRLLPIRLPSIGAVSAWLLLRAFTLGADGIAVLACGAGCRHRCDQVRWKETLEFTKEVLARTGIEPDRLLAVRREEVEAPLRLQGLAEAVVALGPHRLRGQLGLANNGTPDLADILRILAAVAPTPPAPVIGERVPYGVIRVEADRCTLCGACPERCPTGALALREDGKSSQLLFEHARCVACEMCVRVCPERAIGIERRLEFSRLGQAAVLAQDEMARCQRCGAPIAPLSMLRKVERSLNGREESTGQGPGRYCADCGILKSLTWRSSWSSSAMWPMRSGWGSSPERR